MNEGIVYAAVAVGILVVVLELVVLLRAGSARELRDARLRDLHDGLERLEREIRQELVIGRQEAANTARDDREEQSLSLARLSQALAAQLAELGRLQAQQLESFAQQLGRMTSNNDQRFDALRQTIESRLGAMQADNSARLEEMRRTVDEKLHATLEQRLGDSFRLVSERLEQVHKGLGEMHTLATGVGDLKRVLTNVKTRGSWGEVQLDALLDQLLTGDQYARNVATRPNTAERVEFAIRLPGPGVAEGEDRPVWLPIDAKFPLEDYQRLIDAQERADPSALDVAVRALETRLREEARKIREKYVEPPFTTDFAILYLPTEGLYAEALRRPGLADALQRDWRICLAGPTTLAALLNSLQMGFRTLAIERRSSEVWAVLGAIKTEFGKFGEVLEATRRKLEQASRSIESAGVRTRQIERRLRGVEALPASEALLRLGDLEGLDPSEDDR
ncbi:DNA recombination protein RmuC [Accumulibacter sp.]|uniref:DNA recombination protein RmuC n=1 Tax=Accumulibacter sp. TaxID=2053492 RepID=UPI0025FD343C|nr:DNA recombination protein RmuC [Accumulibacter sp.]MCM8596836.1 DNA recombination protein RmuC [Accumulibacter sp.]MCM8624630.1 DNA recombination protein RmuC [Accumulibacter sp.]MDS4050984.1 DNA recombination protein RmuC [Accumulibacter sp.]